MLSTAKLCSIAGCARPYKSRTFCNTHYERWRKHGDPSTTLNPHLTGPPNERFWAYVSKSPGCWLWTGAVSSSGYGNFKVQGKSMKSHVFSFQMTNGPFERGLCVLHKCDTPLCVNPEHLFTGTRADNAVDRDQKGRNIVKRGSENGFAKLTEESVRRIRQMHKEGTAMAALARQFGVSPFPISEIVHNRSWRHVT